MPPPPYRRTLRLPQLLSAAAAVLAGLACALAAPPEERRPLDATTLWKLARLGAPRLSPDGARAVFTVTRFDVETNRSYNHLVMLPTGLTGGGRQLTFGVTPATDPVWSPDGRAIAFVAVRGDDQEPQLYLLPREGGEARRLTNMPTGVATPRWFGDGRRIAFISRVWPELRSDEAARQRMGERANPLMTARVWEHAPFSHADHFLDERVPHLYVTDVDGREPYSPTLDCGQHLDVRETSSESYDIAPDGSEIAFVGDADTSHVRANHDIYVVPAGGGRARDLTADNPADDLDPHYSPDGRWLAYTAQTIPRFYRDTRRLLLRERRSGATRQLAAEFDRSAEGLVWAPDSAGLYGAIDDVATRRIYFYPLSGHAPRPITSGSDYSSLAIAGHPAVLVALRQSFTEPPAVVRVDPRSGATRVLSAINDAALRHVRMGAVESISYPGARGEPIQMWVVKPPGFDPSRRYPLFLILHGGPHDAITDAWQWSWNAQVFAAWGYVAAWPNFHGSSGFGQAFADSITRNWAELPYEDTLRASDWFRSQPWIDAERMVAGGGSYGGYLATVLLGRAHPFKALVAHAAVFDLYTDQASDFAAGKQRYGEFWERPQEFAAQSPNLYAANFNTPTLVIHNQLDMRVPVDQGLELFNILQNRGVPSKLVYFPDEGHWVLKPQNSLFWYATVRDWLGRYAPPEPPAPQASGSNLSTTPLMQ